MPTTPVHVKERVRTFSTGGPLKVLGYQGYMGNFKLQDGWSSSLKSRGPEVGSECWDSRVRHKGSNEICEQALVGSQEHSGHATG